MRSVTNAKSSRPRRDVRALLAATLLLTSIPARAADGGLNPSIPYRVQLGVPGGGAPMEGLDAQNTGTSRFGFPRAETRVIWQARASGGISYSPAADRQTHVVVVQGTTRVAEFDAHGKALWSTKLGAEIASAPAISSNNLRVVVTTSGEVIALDGRGKIRIRKQLPLSDVRPRAVLMARQNGGLALADGRDVIALDAFLDVAWQAKAREVVRTLLEHEGDVLAVTDAGTVHRFRSAAGFGLLGQMPGRISGGAALNARGELIAIVDEHKLAAFNLATNETEIRLFDSLLTLRGPPSVLANGNTRILSNDGLLLFHDSAGQETVRVALEASARGQPARLDRDVARWISDPSGAVALALASRDALLVSADGAVHRIEGTACADPLRPTPLANGHLLFSCKSGMMWRIAGAAPLPKTPS